MELFLGSKIVGATAMTRGAYNGYRGWETPADENPADEGYLVEYVGTGRPNHPNHENYISWSPKDTFDESHASIGFPENLSEEALDIHREAAETRINLRKLCLTIEAAEAGKRLDLTPPYVAMLKRQRAVHEVLLDILNERLQELQGKTPL